MSAAYQSDNATLDSEVHSPVTYGRGCASWRRGRGHDHITTVTAAAASETEGHRHGRRCRRGRGDQIITVASIEVEERAEVMAKEWINDDSGDPRTRYSTEKPIFAHVRNRDTAYH